MTMRGHAAGEGVRKGQGPFQVSKFSLSRKGNISLTMNTCSELQPDVDWDKESTPLIPTGGNHSTKQYMITRSPLLSYQQEVIIVQNSK